MRRLAPRSGFFAIILAAAAPLLVCFWALQARADEASADAPARKAFELAESEIARGRVDDAAKIAASVARTTPYAQIYGQFVDARLAESTGRLIVARDIYRTILTSHPELARVRVHLARTLSALEDVDAARHHYDFLLGGGDIDASFIDRIRTDRQSLESRKRWTASTYISVAPTTNMTSGTSLSAFDLSGASFTPPDASRKRSGIGVLYGGDAAYLAPLADNWGWLATLSTAQRDYAASDFDDRSATVSAGLRYLLPAGVLTGELVAQRRWFANDAYQFALGPRATLRSFLDTRNRFTASVSLNLQRHDELTYQNGKHATVTASWDRFTRPGEFVRLGVSLNHETTQARHLDYRETGLFVGYNFELPSAIVAYPEVAVSWRPYKGDFPFLDTPRKDRQTSASLTMLKKDFNMVGFAPRVQASYLRNRSNVGLYDYNKLEGSLMLTREF